ncbi:MAG: xylulokinase [Pseudomonadota bacterium]|nr:xylulokinase [Pseudomonadota bacterium]
MYVGIDLGTSEVKTLLVDASQRIVAQAGVRLEVSRPQPMWSEQDPELWWTATAQALGRLRAQAPQAWGGVRAIGLSGQMHGATLLDASGRALRPAILWNDTRAHAECLELEQQVPAARAITGNLAMPGFTAPKLLWLRRHEPAVFAQVARVLLPKDWLALRMTGEAVSEPSDAAGTLWLDVARREWSTDMLAACGLQLSHMPRLVEGSEPRGTLRAAIAAEWGLPPGVVVAGGGGDNAASAVGMGVVEHGDALVSLGSSGVMFVATDRFAPNPAGAVHAFCHALPGRWCQMSVTLSAATSLSWLAGITGGIAEGELAAQAAHADPQSTPIFLPYLNGERTPHNDAHARGLFFGLSTRTGTPELAYAVLEGVAFSIADGYAALQAAGTQVKQAVLVGGGARSALWASLIAAACGFAVARPASGDQGGAFGAARLARLAVSGEAPTEVCLAPPPAEVTAPEAALVARLAPRLARYRALYTQTRNLLDGG